MTWYLTLSFLSSSTFIHLRTLNLRVIKIVFLGIITIWISYLIAIFINTLKTPIRFKFEGLCIGVVWLLNLSMYFGSWLQVRILRTILKWFGFGLIFFDWFGYFLYFIGYAIDIINHLIPLIHLFFTFDFLAFADDGLLPKTLRVGLGLPIGFDREWSHLSNHWSFSIYTDILY